MTTLMTANRNWASRPADERFQNIDAMAAVMAERRDTSSEFYMSPESVTFVAEENQLKLKSNKTGLTADMTNYAFKTLAARLEVPYSFVVSRLRAETVAHILNDRHKVLNERSLVMLQKQGNDRLIRAFTSESYARVWDADLLDIYRPLLDNGWYTPIAFHRNEPASATFIATEADVGKFGGKGGVQVKAGDRVVPSGLYSSDRDMFMMLINRENHDDGYGRPLFSGLMVSHSEVYNAPFKETSFMCDGICLNNIVWGATDISETNYRHVGNAKQRIMAAATKTVTNLIRNHTVNLNSLRDTIKKARGIVLGKYQDDIVDDVYRRKISPLLTKSTLENALELAQKNRDTNGNPFSLYGLFDGLTRYSQTFEYTEDRSALDEVASKILATAR